jgi:hypothetical protein
MVYELIGVAFAPFSYLENHSATPREGNRV